MEHFDKRGEIKMQLSSTA